MKRGKFIMAIMAFYPLSLLADKSRNALDRAVKGFKVNSGEARFGEHFRMKGVTQNVLDLKISAKDTGGDLSVFVQTGFTPQGGPPLHVHLFQDEYFYILEGEYLFQVGNDKYSMRPGETVFLPRNVPHAFTQLTTNGKVLVSYLPAGKMESFFKTTAAWKSPPTPAEIARVFEDHDMKVVGPPLKV